MARRYARDNRGRFSSTGATARGGRLATASGKKRATVTSSAGMVSQGRLTGAPLKGTIGKTSKARLSMGLTRPSKPGQRDAYNAARTQLRAKPAANVKPARAAAKPAATASRLGSRLNPAKKADRAATRKFEQAYERENRIRSSLFRGNKSLQTRQAITKELDKASNLTKTMQMQRRGIRAQFPVQTKDRARRAVGSKPSGTISQNKDIRNVVNRREAFKRKVNRAGALSRPGDDKKARRTTQVRAKAMATYQGARRPEISDSTVGRFGQSRTSTAFRAPASRLAAPSRAARRQGKALALAQKPIRDQFGRRIGNPKKQQRSKKTGSRALSFYQNPKAAAQSVLRDRGNRGLSTKGFRKPRAAATAKPAASKPAAKLPREARLQRAVDTATRIAKARSEKAATAAATFADRRKISSRASSKGRSAAFAKEEAAGKQSAQALRSSLRADARASNLRQTMGAAAQAARSRAAAPKPAAKPATRKVDLSASAFSRRAEVAGVRANFAGSAVRGLDRANPSNRKAFAKADALQAASDRYSSIVRKSRGGEFTAAQVFQGMNTKRSTVPTRSEKAAKTRADKKLKALEANIKAAERARRRG